MTELTCHVCGKKYNVEYIDPDSPAAYECIDCFRKEWAIEEPETTEQNPKTNNGGKQMKYTADTEAMQEYAQILASIGRLDGEAERIAQSREQLLRRLQEWELAHKVEEGVEAENEPATEPVTEQ